MSLENLPLPELLKEPPTHPSLKDARLRVDPKVNAPYLLCEDIEDGKIRVIKINRIKARNGFDDWLYLVLSDALNQAAQDEKVLTVVLTGEGEFFSSGADLHAEMDGGQGLKLGNGMILDPVGVFMRTFLRFPKPIVAAVNGPAIGVGCTMLPHCDIVYAADNAYFLSPFSRIAVVPEFGSSITFPAILGKSTANEMLLWSKPLPAARAKELGFVSNVFPQKTLLENVLKEVRAGMVFPVLDRTLPLFKHMIRTFQIDHMERLIMYELERLDERANNGDTAEAIIAFMSKGKKAAL